VKASLKGKEKGKKREAEFKVAEQATSDGGMNDTLSNFLLI